jgi:DNA-binding NarL/FixJ family response regulator
MICSPLVGHSRPDPFRPSALQVLVADDHEMVRMALKHALAPLAADIVWREAVDAQCTEDELERCGGFDLALIDLHMPGSGGACWIERLHRKHPAVPLIVLTGDESPGLAEELIAAGVAGFIPKSDTAAVVLNAVQLVLSGGTYAPLRLFARADRKEGPGTCAVSHVVLTERQRDVLALLARGLPNKLIARGLGLSEATVKVHLLAIFRALDVRNRTEAVVAASKKLRANGLTQAETPGAPGS